MKNTYWDQFMATGSISDYLSYKMEKETTEREKESPPKHEADWDYNNVSYFRSDLSGKDMAEGNERV
ncbi:MAG TPA: hypothetical protein H9730_04705 [Candidatus Mediterraneibacter stercoripullorum]|nr:hypothetical protein [Candidatus Mediterraneibacter stercoripullorum]